MSKKLICPDRQSRDDSSLLWLIFVLMELVWLITSLNQELSYPQTYHNVPQTRQALDWILGSYLSKNHTQLLRATYPLLGSPKVWRFWKFGRSLSLLLRIFCCELAHRRCIQSTMSQLRASTPLLQEESQALCTIKLLLHGYKVSGAASKLWLDQSQQFIPPFCPCRGGCCWVSNLYGRSFGCDSKPFLRWFGTSEIWFVCSWEELWSCQ